MTTKQTVHHYYVDEAGDLALFNTKGRSIVGEAGVSKFFMVGVAQISDPNAARKRLTSLRAKLLADPYFTGVPSMQPSAGKTASQFHAAKDLAEVRREVFAILPDLGAKIYVAIRRKGKLAPVARAIHRLTGQRWQEGNIYDDLVKRLFRNLLHKADENRIVFARHAKWGRREALAMAIQKAKSNFEAKYGLASHKPTGIASAFPREEAGLQVIDYYLWALQRLFERGDDRFFNLLRPNYRLIMDLDDTRRKGYGEWYNDKNPLTREKITPPAG